MIWGLRDPAMLPGLLHGLEEYVQDLTVVRIEAATLFSGEIIAPDFGCHGGDFLRFKLCDGLC